MLTKQRKNTKDLINWMIQMTTFNMELMSIHLKINKALTATKKVALMMMAPVAE